MKWRVASADTLTWKDWDDGAAVYDARSGRTHILNLVARLIVMELIERKEVTAEELSRRAGDLLELPPDDPSLGDLSLLMRDLASAGLIERAD